MRTAGTPGGRPILPRITDVHIHIQPWRQLKPMELGYGHPMGPLKVSDLVGLDVRLAIVEYRHRTLGGAHYAPPTILRDKVARGELGKEDGNKLYRVPWTPCLGVLSESEVQHGDATAVYERVQG